MALQEQLVDLVGLWLRMMPAESARQRLAEVREDLGRTYFTWHGETDGTQPIYYRVQGPRLIVEFSTQDQDSGHEHTILPQPHERIWERGNTMTLLGSFPSRPCSPAAAL